MAIKYTLGRRCTAPNSKEKTTKVIALAQHNAMLDIKQMAQHIHDHGSLLDRATIESVLIKLAECMREQLLQGNGVELGDLGRFYLSLRNTPTASAEEFSVEDIKDVEVRWRPGEGLRNLKKDAEFELTTWRSRQPKSPKSKNA